MLRSRRGFSLVELMVVVGIIAILIAMLLPTVHAAVESSKAIQCASQLRQIGQAIYNYAANNQGLTPAWGKSPYGPDDPNRSDAAGRGWTTLLLRYAGAEADGPLYHCPSYPVDDRTNTYFLTSRWEYLQTPSTRSIALGRVHLATQFLLAAEATSPPGYLPPFGTWRGPADNLDKDDSGKPRLVFFGEPNGYNMHRGGNNILFADAHVQIFKKHDASAITYAANKMQRWDEVTGE
jgi:prepilin-type N-terminal cleavage/methylation domain-containing protein/prepilin-type processing-associated H-X9-DG protein